MHKILHNSMQQKLRSVYPQNFGKGGTTVICIKNEININLFLNATKHEIL